MSSSRMLSRRDCFSSSDCAFASFLLSLIRLSLSLRYSTLTARLSPRSNRFLNSAIYIKFFANKERTQRFYDLEIENFNEENIITGLLSAICRTRTCSFEEVIRVMLTDSELTDNKFLSEVEKYGLLEDFWKLCEQHFGYTDVKPTLEKLVVTMFVTYTAKYVGAELPKAWKGFISYKAGNIIAFMDNLMNNILYRGRYDELSAHVANGLNANKVFSAYPAEDLVNCDTFLTIDRILIKWIVERLLAEDMGAALDGLTLPQVCEKRSKMHFGEKTGVRYRMLSSAYQIIQAGNYHCRDSFKDILRQYQEEDFRLDWEYEYMEEDRNGTPISIRICQRTTSSRQRRWRQRITWRCLEN